MVVDVIWSEGRVSLNRLSELLPAASRASMQRAVANLRDYGQVCTRLADNAFELSSKLDFSVANGHFLRDSVGPCGGQNTALYGEGARREVDITMFTALGEVEIIERIRDEIFLLFPLLGDENFDAYGKSARMNLKHKGGQLLWDSICTTPL